MSEGHWPGALAQKLTAIEEIDAEVEALRVGRRRATRIWVAVTLSTMAAALPGGILYSLYWGIGYLAAGGVLSLNGHRKLRELEDRRDALLAE